MRLRGKAVQDGTEGWISLKGNAGTVYASLSTKHQKAVKDVAMHKTFKSTGAPEEIRIVKKGESLEIVEGPKAEKFETVVKAKGRLMGDGVVGWIPLSHDTMKPWAPTYKVLVAQPLHDKKGPKDAKEVRELELGETLDLLEGPVAVTEDDTTVLRMRGRSKKDEVGWATIRDAEKKALLRC